MAPGDAHGAGGDFEGFYFFLVFAHEEATFERLAMVEPPIVARGLRFALGFIKPAFKHTRVA